MSKPADPVQTNAQIFRVYLRRLSNPADQDIFITSANKLAVFLSNTRAYYAEAQQPVVELLEISLNSLKNVAPDVFRKSDSMDRSLIPPEQAPLFDAFDKLANSITPYVPLFTNKSLSNRLLLFLSTLGITLLPETQVLKSPDASMQTSTPRSAVPQAGSMASQAIVAARNTPPTSSSTVPVALRNGSATPTPAPAPVSSMAVESPSASGLDEVTVDHEVVSTPTQQAPASGFPSRKSPLSHGLASGAVVSTARIESNLPPQALQPPSAPTPSILPLLHTQSLSPISDPQVATIPLQKVAPSPSASYFDVPVSASPTNISHGPMSQSSKSPPLDGAVQVSQNLLPSLARVRASGPALVSVSSPSIQQNPILPPRRQSSGLDFLQLDLQAAREKKQRAVAEAVRSGSMAHVSSPTSSISGRATPATTTATSIPVAITGTPAPSTPVQPPFSPTTPVAARGTPALTSPILRTPPPVNPPAAISSESDDSSALQPQKAQNAASRPVHRDLRQRSSRSSGSAPSTPRLQITDRAPAPPPEPGSLGAPIIIDEDEEGPISVPTDEKMEVDAPVEALPNGEAKQGDEDSAGGHPKPRPQQQESVASDRVPEQDAQSTSRVLVSEAAVSVPDTAVSAQEPSAHGENDGKDADMDSTTTLVVAERETTTATLAQNGDGERGTMEISVDSPSVSGTTIEQPSALDKVSPSTAVGVMAVPEVGITETTPFTPPATAPTAATAEAPPIMADEFIKVLLDMIARESDAQPQSTTATGEHADGASVADVPPTSGTGKHRRSPTPDGDARRVIPRTSPIAEGRQDLPATPDIAQPTIPALTVSLVPQQRENEDGSVGVVGLSSSLGPEEPRTAASINLSTRLLGTNRSLTDMDISRSSTPPIVVLKTLSESASGTNSSNSRSDSPSGRKASEAEDDEMVDELAPHFGKEMRVLAMFRPYDIPGVFSLDCFLVDADWKKITIWNRAPVDIDLDISQARCVSLACYSVQDLEPQANASQPGENREHWFENARPVPWPKMPRHLWFLVNDEYTILYPPYEAEEDLFDVSQYLRRGQNKINFTQIDSMADYVLVLHAHYPTRKQTTRVRARWDERKRFQETLTWLARPISPTI